MSATSLNVFGQALRVFSLEPVTGFYRDGYCRTSATDTGNHAIAGIVTDKFLDRNAMQGNNLRPIGLTHGCKWCLCTSRWLQAVQDYREGHIAKEDVPKVQLSATDQSALRKIDLQTLQEFAAKEDFASFSS